ncbi:MAG: hypothetical protein JSV19_02410 [Phycisphaerales bacterium]|nr:MAG: hypothetical protein JSV19_02410 [Phycisphaerales bacterium]
MGGVEHPDSTAGTRRGSVVTRPRAGAMLAVVALLAGNGGCFSGSLASSTGPRVRGPWSVADEQYAHRGEEVLFDFVISKPLAKRPLDPTGIADYCVLQIDDTRFVAQPDLDGHFRFAHTLRSGTPDTVIKASATAYRTMGRPDLPLTGAQLGEPAGPVDEPDEKVAADSVRLVLYQARIVLELQETPSRLDFASGRMQIRKADGTTTSVYGDQPDRPGFRAAGPADGRYTITYEPRAEELNPIGTTEIEFTVYDQTGRCHEVTATLDTP